MEKANLSYGMLRARVKRIFEQIEKEICDNGLERAMWAINRIYMKNLHWSDKKDSETQEEYDMLGDGLDALEESYANEVSAHHMKIEVGKTKEGKKYYVLYFEVFKDDGESDEIEWSECSRCPIIEVDGHDMISWTFINKIRELAYLGYVMCHSKEYEAIDLDKEYEVIDLDGV